MPFETHKRFPHLHSNALKCRTCRARREVRLTCGCVGEGALPRYISLASITTKMFDEYFSGWKADRRDVRYCETKLTWSRRTWAY